MQIYYGWWVVFSCFMVAFYVGGTVFYSFTAYINPLVETFGWSYAQISLAMSIRGLEMGIFAPVAGFLVDRFGSRFVILFGMVTVGAGLLVLSFTNSLFMFYSAFILLSLGAGGCTSVVLMNAVVRWFDRRVGLAVGIASCGFGASGLMVPVVVKLIEIYQWQTTLVIVAVGAWVIGIPVSLIIRDAPAGVGEPAADRPDDRKMPKRRSQGLPFREVLKSKDFLLLIFSEATRMMVVLSVITHIMPYLTSHGFSRQTAGMVAAAVPSLSMAGRLFFGWLGDTTDKRLIFSGTYTLMGIGLLAFAYLRGDWIMILFLVTFTPGYGGGLTMRAAFIKEYFGVESFGKIIGATMGVGSLAGIVGPTLTGYIFDTRGSYDHVWIAASILIFMVSLVMLPSRKQKQTSRA